MPATTTASEAGNVGAHRFIAMSMRMAVKPTSNGHMGLRQNLNKAGEKNVQLVASHPRNSKHVS